MMRTLLLAAAILATTVGSLPALTIVQTQGFMGQPSIDKLVEFDRYYPEKGTLQSIEWQIGLGISDGALTVDNDGALPATVFVELGASANMLSTDVGLLDADLSPIGSGLDTLEVTTGSELELAGDNGDGMTFDPTLPDAATHEGGVASVVTSGFVHPDLFADYIGTTPFSVNVDVNQVLDFGSTGGISGQFEPVMSESNISLIYSFNLVPEPTTSLTGMFGLWALVAAARRRRRRRA